MAGFFDLEKRAGAEGAVLIKKALKESIKGNSKTKTGTAERTAGARAVYKNERLQRIVLKAEHYVFKQNYGFEGTKKNSVNMRLHATEVISKAVENTGVLEVLADSISNIRSEQVLSRINFGKNG